MSYQQSPCPFPVPPRARRRNVTAKNTAVAASSSMKLNRLGLLSAFLLAIGISQIVVKILNDERKPYRAAQVEQLKRHSR